ncbi:hypothetical protein B4135_1203 [Caldibacillus debilis]|uniref:Uncharacterized protein n=1 Tax=Caldibacillus debilis TaxID=301148 RepID=A0A150MDT4_9BACI|nr:hypothetical protein B4135_1203 [Caldibacillus debilis]
MAPGRSGSIWRPAIRGLPAPNLRGFRRTVPSCLTGTEFPVTDAGPGRRGPGGFFKGAGEAATFSGQTSF